MSKRHSSNRTVLVKELHARHRPKILRHLLALDTEDRSYRFGSSLSDESITSYVEAIDFDVDKVFGVFSYRFHLVGVGHLSFIANPRHPLAEGVAERVAELGLSVSKKARGHGIGEALFKRTTTHCRNANVTTLYLHYLRSNAIMMHLAQKAGMEVQNDHDESEAYLKIPPADPASFLQEAIEEQVAHFDYSMKANTKSVMNFFRKR